jgi:diaminohydroxyphosphoribosylaminopyrimidine deaminase/5-amino-6-(5-phosphoribosylamino)uracil reductase
VQNVSKKPEADIDLTLSRRAIDLAAKGTGLVSPNPLVGCVITAPNGEIVGEGTYIYNDITHAEVLALAQAGDRARGGTAYVSLEPHDHQGRTPPCTEALINAGIRRVVSPIVDPNPKVSGKGFERLRKAGIEVTTGILAKEASRLNEKFIVWHRENRPFVHLKMAMSLDGRISLKNSVSTALSGEASSSRVQELRHEHDAILVGGNTASVDNPSLTDRSGKPRRRPLVRVVLDNRLQIQDNSVLVKTSGATPTIVFSNSSDDEKIERLSAEGVTVSRANARDLSVILSDLHSREIQSILVEGGTEVAGAFVDAGLVDKVTFIVAPIVIGGNAAPHAIGGKGAESLAETLRLNEIEIKKLGEDIEITGYPEP